MRDEENDSEDEKNLEESELEEDPEENEYEPFENGYYVSGHNILGFHYNFSGSFALFEFDCVSNERLDYLPFDCNYIGQIDENVVYGASYKYEVILNGHTVKFSNENLDYSVKNGRIIIQGMIDGNKENYNQKKFEDLVKKHGFSWYLQKQYEEYRMKYWAQLRLKEFIPEKMKLV